MNIKQPIPESLRTYAASAIGSFQSRYDQILDRAFADHQLILNVSQLRELAGGGSSSTAQESLERFRQRLNNTLSDRVRFGPDMPAEVAQRMGTVMTELWVECRKQADAEFDVLRQSLEDREKAAVTLGNELREQYAELKAQSEAQINEGLQAVALLDQKVATLKGSLEATNKVNQQITESNTTLSTTLELMRTHNANLQAWLDAAKVQASEVLASHAAEKESMRQQAALQMQEVRREHAQLNERLVKERDSARAAENRERSAAAEATISLARSEQKASQLTQQLDSVNAELKRAREQFEATKNQSNEYLSTIAVLEAAAEAAKGEIQILKASNAALSKRKKDKPDKDPD